MTLNYRYLDIIIILSQDILTLYNIYMYIIFLSHSLSLYPLPNMKFINANN